MPAKTTKPAKAKSTRKAKPAPKAAKAASPKAVSPSRTAKEAVRRTTAELHFTETTIIRGEAVEPGEALPSGATHEIAGHDASGQPILKRKRFSIC